MALSKTWWILCAVLLSCVVGFGSCRGHGGGRAQPGLIFNELCALKDESGLCKAIIPQFFFNVNTGRCELFDYGGCGGNANNFATIEACEETCLVSEDKNPCHLPEAPGPCRGLVKRYFFHSESQQCKHFFYGGCFGNANNFRSMSDCQARCQNPVKATEEPEVLVHSARKAFAVQPTVIKGEFQGNMNETDQEIKDPTPSDPCSQPLERGTCNGAERRFAFNPKTRKCHVFRYSGCGGNENNFSHRRECRLKCGRRRRAHGGMLIRIRKKNLDNIVNRSG